MAASEAAPAPPIATTRPYSGRDRRSWTALAAAAALALVLTACGTPHQDGPAPGEPGPDTNAGAATTDETGIAPERAAPRPPVTAQREMVAAAEPLAAQAGLEILRQGGNAMDAAVATQAMLTLVEPQSSGIGGGGFLMHFDGKSGEMATYEGRETAPAAVTENLFLGPDGTPLPEERYRVGGFSVAVPGTLRMLEKAHAAHGRLPWQALFEPAIRAAREGFAVPPRLHASIAADGHLSEYAAAREYLFDARGNPLAAGATLRNPMLADTLARVAADGAKALHTGPIAADIVDAVRGDNARPGLMMREDIAGYEAFRRGQLCGPYRTWLICGFGPPTAGGVTTLMTLAMLERFDLAELAPFSAEAVHLIAEATRLANADRLRYVGDPGFVDVPVSNMLDFGYLARRSRLIAPGRALERVSAGELQTAQLAPSADNESPSTTHFSIVDPDGNAVAMTGSVGHAFGSRLFVRGFFLNNHSTDFSEVPRTKSGRPKVNRAEGGKRPRSAQSPTLVFDGSGRLVLALGSPGGPRIIGYVVKTIIAHLDWGMDVQAAISSPNIAVRGDRIDLERGTAITDIAAELRAMGHEVRVRRLNSGIQAIAIEDGVLKGGADPRRGGVAVGN